MTRKLRKIIRSHSDSRGHRKFTTQLELAQVNWEKMEKVFVADRDSFIKRIKKGKIINPHTKEILTLLAGGAVFGLSIVFPALPMALSPFIIDKNKFNNRYYNQTMKRLEKQKLVEIVYEGDQTIVRITKEGKVRALRYKLSEMQVKRPKVWDKKWRIVIFDIPEKYKRVRELFRWHLKSMNFYMLQKSVWVHPYPCEGEIEFLRQVYKVGINVTYILAEKLENSQYLKDRFELS